MVCDKGDYNDIPNLIAHMNLIEGKEGYFTDTFCKKSQFFQPKNGAKVDAIRTRIWS